MARSSYSPVSAISGAAGSAKQPHLSRGTVLREAAQPKQSSADSCPCMRREGRNGQRSPVLSATGRVWQEAEVTCSNYDWESGGRGKNNKQKQLFIVSTHSPSVFIWSSEGRAVTHALECTVISMNYWTVVSGWDIGQRTCMLQSDKRVKRWDYLKKKKKAVSWRREECGCRAQAAWGPY